MSVSALEAKHPQVALRCHRVPERFNRTDVIPDHENI